MIRTLLRLLGSMVTLLLLAAGFQTFGAKPPASVPAMITFLNRGGDKITSDVDPVYSDMVGGVSAVFNQQTNDLVLGIDQTSSRRIRFDFSSPFVGYNNQGVSWGTRIVVGSVYNIPVGEIRQCVSNMDAGVINNIVATVRFGNLPSETLFQSTKVVVVRETSDRWLISTTVGVTDPWGTGEEFGDKAALAQTTGKGRNTTTTISYYHMPFQFTANLKP